MKTGLILEGGAMRGMYTAGALDVFLEQNIQVDGVVGVSAGAVFGCNYKSRQIGRVIRYNTKYCKDPRYMSLRSLLKTGDLYGEQFCYHDIPERLDVFDTATYQANPVDFYVTCTDVHTGKPVYRLCNKGDAEEIQWMRASASMPMAARVVSVGGYDLLDGGVADSIPIRWFRSQGYEKNIVILTRARGYRKSPNKMLPLMRISLRKYPALVEAMACRHQVYNDTLDELFRLEQSGEVLVLAPSQPVTISRTENDPEKLRALYQLGRRDAEDALERIKAFLTE